MAMLSELDNMDTQSGIVRSLGTLEMKDVGQISKVERHIIYLSFLTQWKPNYNGHALVLLVVQHHRATAKTVRRVDW